MSLRCFLFLEVCGAFALDNLGPVMEAPGAHFGVLAAALALAVPASVVAALTLHGVPPSGGIFTYCLPRLPGSAAMNPSIGQVGPGFVRSATGDGQLTASHRDQVTRCTASALVGPRPRVQSFGGPFPWSPGQVVR